MNQRPTILVAVSVFLLVATGCSNAGGHELGTAPGKHVARTIHAEGKGPLSAHSGSGGLFVQPPANGATPWNATFGFFLLCNREPGSQLKLQKVRFDASVAPLEENVYLRTINPGGKAGVDPAFSAFYGALGSPPSFKEDYVTYRPQGSFQKGVAGTKVTTACAGVPNLRKGFLELDIALTSGSVGAELDHTYVDYSYDGKPYSLRIDWTMGLCGSNPKVASNCRRQ